MVKIRDVAAEAGVSVATVSRALNHISTVDPALAQRVHHAADRLGYYPNVIARSLRRQSTSVIALIISDVSNPFFTAITRGVEDVAQQNGYSVLLCNADENAEKEATYLRVAAQTQVAGVIISPHSASSDVSGLRSARIPLVVVDRPLQDDADSVMVQSRESARIATEHLLAEGWVRPAIITGPFEASTAQDRVAGYVDAMSSAAIADIIEYSNFRQDGGEAAARRLLDRAAPPDALVVANAQMALGVLSELGRRGLSSGRDIGIVTFDDAPWAPFVTPPMSVVTQPAYEVGSRAARMLVERIQGDALLAVRAETFASSLVVRDSSRRRTAK